MAIAAMTAITRIYPGLARPAVDGLDLSIEAGEILVIVGANGSGKTTAMEILCGLRQATTGEVEFLGQRVRPGGPHRARMGVQLQEGGLPQRLRVREALRAVECLYRDPGDVDAVVAALGLNEHLQQMVDKLSGGWQRRLDIAIACIGGPDLLVLDEPTSGLDPVARAELWEFLRERRSRGVAVLASTHDLAEAEAYADRLVVLEKGRCVLNGPVAHVLSMAGGDFRLRVLSCDARCADAVEAWGAVPLRSGSSVSVVGQQAELTQLREHIERLRRDGEITFTDALLGPIRLEDIFAFAGADRLPEAS